MKWAQKTRKLPFVESPDEGEYIPVISNKWGSSHSPDRVFWMEHFLEIYYDEPGG